MGNQDNKNDSENLQEQTDLKVNSKDDKTNSETKIKNKEDFQHFREIIQRYEYYTKLLKLSFKNNKVLKILYEPESSLDNYYLEMFYILEKIPYINYNEFIKLSGTHNKNIDNNDILKDNNENYNRVKFDLSNNNYDYLVKKNTQLNSISLKNTNRPNLKNRVSFNISLPDQPSLGLFKYNNEKKNLYNELIYLMEKICLYDIKKIQKILLIYPINNLRWIIWLSVARSKYNQTQSKLNISNTDIYNELVNKIELKNDSLMFELHNTLKELNVFKCNWSTCLYKIIKCLLLYRQDFNYESGMNVLIGVPLLISDCNEEDTFFFARYLFSSYYGLGLCYFFGEDELLLNYLVYIVKYLVKERYSKIYDHLINLKIAEELWIKKWIKTFFSSVFDLSITIRVWDCVIGVGIKFLVNYSLAIFEYFKDKILQLKKVKYFLEFFDYDLKKKYTKKKDILNFREEIIRLAQSYYIPDGKYQLIEKDYLNFLFKDKESIKSEPFDTSRTINNYYSNNNSLDDEEYHIKLILRTIIYIPSEYLQNNVEDKAIYKFKKKKEEKWLEAQKSLKKIDEMEKDSEKTLKNDINNINNINNIRLYSSNVNSGSDSKVNNEEKKSNNLNLSKNEINLNPIDKIMENNTNNKNNEMIKNELIKTSENNKIESKSDTNNVDKNINKIKNNEDINEDKEEEEDEDEEFSNYDIAFDLSFHDEQLPDYINE